MHKTMKSERIFSISSEVTQNFFEFTNYNENSKNISESSPPKVKNLYINENLINNCKLL